MVKLDGMDETPPLLDLQSESVRNDLISQIQQNVPVNGIPPNMTLSRVISESLLGLYTSIHAQTADSHYIDYCCSIQKELTPSLNLLRRRDLRLAQPGVIDALMTHLEGQPCTFLHPQESVAESIVMSLVVNKELRKSALSIQAEIVDLLTRAIVVEGWSSNSLCYQSRRDEFLINADPVQTLYELLQLVPEPMLRENAPLSELLVEMNQAEPPRTFTIRDRRFPDSYSLHILNLLNGNVNWAVKHFPHEHVPTHSSVTGDAFITGLEKIVKDGAVGWYEEYIKAAAKQGMVSLDTLVSCKDEKVTPGNSVELVQDPLMPDVQFHEIGSLLLSTHINIYQCIMSGAMERQVNALVGSAKSSQPLDGNITYPQRGLRL